nr:YcaO-like family protein [Polymorphobacter sp.]
MAQTGALEAVSRTGNLDAVAVEAGVSRLADVTGLDCIGVPVWQAVRPWSRALSVHQGKGASVAVARRGAVMEAVESHHAEQWRPDAAMVMTGRAWLMLDAAVRPGAADDFAVVRGLVAGDTPMDWTMVAPLGESTGFVVPVLAVGLDCTIVETGGVSIDSNGLAAHFDVEAATLSALLELIERDAVGSWRRASPVVRSGTAVAVAGVDCPLVGDWAERCARRGIAVRLYAIDAVVPVVVAELHAAGADRAEHRHVWGSAAALDWRAAVRAAMLEALQTRCSQIAGARDTIPIRHAEHAEQAGGRAQGFGLPDNGDWAGHPLPVAGAITDLDGLVAALIRSGRRQVGRMVVSPPGSAAVTVKAFVPGMGFESRASRAP